MTVTEERRRQLADYHLRMGRAVDVMGRLLNDPDATDRAFINVISEARKLADGIMPVSMGLYADEQYSECGKRLFCYDGGANAVGEPIEKTRRRAIRMAEDRTLMALNGLSTVSRTFDDFKAVLIDRSEMPCGTEELSDMIADISRTFYNRTFELWVAVRMLERARSELAEDTGNSTITDMLPTPSGQKEDSA